MDTAAAQAAHDAYFAEGIIPGSAVVYAIVILVVAAIALWQARAFVSKF